jgi:hypothetical protein
MAVSPQTEAPQGQPKENHENTKGRKHEKDKRETKRNALECRSCLLLFLDFVFSYFRTFVILFCPSYAVPSNAGSTLKALSITRLSTKPFDSSLKEVCHALCSHLARTGIVSLFGLGHGPDERRPEGLVSSAAKTAIIWMP